MSSKDTSRLSIEVPADLHRQLKLLAAFYHTTITDLVLRCLVENLVSKNVPNEETLRIFAETDRGENLTLYENIDELFENLDRD
jgi:hypothetical protein